eukprot:CAMPEP_0181495712 /NCGR_PEP_ID=MMETSP1110-20121109/52545_1 /TAXON_ID=174948 /ORGANISM="Symbiodinium sp., Strain CCMP421" /LENGTH=126 /DNA_ID=CAMNT_0023623397 /DNA_START=38 /DNA_END=415 /DNA_ORIENTATION=+
MRSPGIQIRFRSIPGMHQWSSRALCLAFHGALLALLGEDPGQQALLSADGLRGVRLDFPPDLRSPIWAKQLQRAALRRLHLLHLAQRLPLAGCHHKIRPLARELHLYIRVLHIFYLPRCRDQRDGG